MKKFLNFILLTTSLLGYLEWGKDKHAFIFQVEYDLISGAYHSESFLHPFILIPLCGQILLLFTLFQKKPGKFLTLAGLSCLSFIMLFLFLIGLLSLKVRIIASVIPFLLTGILVLVYRPWVSKVTTN